MPTPQEFQKIVIAKSMPISLLPELVETFTPSIAAIWLSASNEFFEQRIYNTSQYETKSPSEKKMIDQFLERTCLYSD